MKYKDPVTGEIKTISVKAGDTLPIGSVVEYAGSTAPANWLFVGTEVLKTDYPELYAIIGDIYNDENTPYGYFKVYNKKGLVTVGIDADDSDFDTIGKKYGEKTHTLTVAEIPEHKHGIQWGTEDGGTANSIKMGVNKTGISYDQCKNTGGGQPHNNVQPSIVGNFICKAKNSVGLIGNVTDIYSESTQDSYSCEYINNKVDGVALYENNDGTTSNITLSEEPSGNYDFIEIYGISSDNIPCYIKIKSDDYDKRIILSAFALDGNLYFKLARLSLSGTTLSFLQNSEFYKSSDTVNGSYTASGDFIKITKVIGYK